MTEDEIKTMLPNISTDALVKELRTRFDSVRKAQEELGLGFGSPVTKRAIGRPTGSSSTSKATMSAAAFNRWGKWKQYKKDHPNATTKDYFAARRKEQKK